MNRRRVKTINFNLVKYIEVKNIVLKEVYSFMKTNTINNILVLILL